MQRPQPILQRTIPPHAPPLASPSLMKAAGRRKHDSQKQPDAMEHYPPSTRSSRRQPIVSLVRGSGEETAASSVFVTTSIPCSAHFKPTQHPPTASRRENETMKAMVDADLTAKASHEAAMCNLLPPLRWVRMWASERASREPCLWCGDRVSSRTADGQSSHEVQDDQRPQPQIPINVPPTPDSEMSPNPRAEASAKPSVLSPQNRQYRV